MTLALLFLASVGFVALLLWYADCLLDEIFDEPRL